MSNKDDLQAVFRFKKNSTLHDYLKIKKPYEGWIAFTLWSLLDAIFSIVYKEKRFDPSNRKIIICGHQLTHALNTPVFHKKQLKEYVLKQIQYLAPPQHLPFYNYKTQVPMYPLTLNNETHLLPIHCTLSKPLKKVFSTLPNFPKQQSTLSYNQICNLMSTYILTNHHRIIDKRNKYICLIKNDPLHKVFNVKAFHQCQITKLLKKHIHFKK
jgi:hypothetical protein